MNLTAVMVAEFIGCLLITCSRIVPDQDPHAKHLHTCLAIICSVSALVCYTLDSSEIVPRILTLFLVEQLGLPGVAYPHLAKKAK